MCYKLVHIVVVIHVHRKAHCLHRFLHGFMDVFDASADQLTAKLWAEAKGGDVIQLSNFLHKTTLDIIGQVLPYLQLGLCGICTCNSLQILCVGNHLYKQCK